MEKLESLDLKTGETVTPEPGPAETTEQPTETPEAPAADEAKEEPKEQPQEDVEALPQWAKERLKKVEEEKENYKKGMLKYKKRSLEPEEQPEEKKEEEYPDWDEASKKFQKQTLTEAERIAEKKAQQIVEKANEKSAINDFISQHPELEDDAKWSEVVSNYNSKHGKDTVESIKRDLERAYFLARFEKGEISQIESDAFKKGETKGKAEAQVAELASVSKTTSKSVKEGKTVSNAAMKLAEKMRVDLKKLAEEDDSLTAEIKL